MLLENTIDILDIMLRSLISLAVLFIITRFMGKKQISQLTFFDYAIGISIGSIAAEMAVTDDIPYQHALVSMLVYGIISVIISVATNKSLKARRFFTGKTFLLIDRGKILEKNLSKVRYDVNDLLAEARLAGYFDISDIDYALIETSGKISFMPTIDKTPPTLSDLKIKKLPEGLTANVVIDGEIMKKNLEMTGLNEEWLRKEMDKQRVKRLSDIILATVDSNNKLTVYQKTGKIVPETFID